MESGVVLSVMEMTPGRTCSAALTWLCLVNWPDINFILQGGRLRHEAGLVGWGGQAVSSTLCM